MYNINDRHLQQSDACTNWTVQLLCIWVGGEEIQKKGGRPKVFTGDYVRGSQLLQIKLVNPICYTFMVQTDILTSINMSICMMAETKCFFNLRVV